MNSDKDLKEMSELDIIRILKDEDADPILFNRACDFLLKKYNKMFHRHWWILQRQMDNSPIINNLKDEYYAQAYEAFFSVIKKVDLNKVYDENFKIMQLLSWYLSNVRSKIIRQALKKGKEKALNNINSSRDEDCMTVDADVEESYWTNEGYRNEPSYKLEMKEREEACNRVVQACYNKWNSRDKKLFILLRDHKSKVEIAEAMNTTTTKVYMRTCKLKKDIKRALGENALNFK